MKNKLISMFIILVLLVGSGAFMFAQATFHGVYWSLDAGVGACRTLSYSSFSKEDKGTCSMVYVSNPWEKIQYEGTTSHACFSLFCDSPTALSVTFLPTN